VVRFRDISGVGSDWESYGMGCDGESTGGARVRLGVRERTVAVVRLWDSSGLGGSGLVL
jgi:hypothetical protein